MKEGGLVNERLKELRKALNCTQHEFAERLRISRNNIATYETGKSNPGDSVIALICREFNVNEDWLRTGEGEMFIQLSRDEEIAAFMGNILSGGPDFRRRLISVLAQLSTDEWKLLAQMAQKLTAEMEKEKTDP